jgi:hypothetical protein
VTERTYPREWFRVTRHANEVTTREFVGETPMTLKEPKGRFTKKFTLYEQWYPTREEAQAALDIHKAAQVRAARDTRIRNAAPQLLDALEDMVNAFGTPAGAEDIAALIERLRS